MRVAFVVVLAALALGLGCGGGKAGNEGPFSREILLADSQWSRNDLDLAKTTLQRILDKNPDDYDALYRMAFLTLDTDPKQGLEMMTRCAALRPGYPGPVFMSGMCRLMLRQFQQADEEMGRGFEMALDHAGIVWPEKAGTPPRGLAELRRNRFREAASLLAKATKEQQSRPAYWFLYATALFRAGVPDSAWDAVGHALDMRAGYAEALALRAEILRARGNFDQARAVLEKSLAIRPELGAAHFQMGLVQGKAHEIRDATRSFWWSVLDDPTLPDSHQFVASSFGEMQMSEAAPPHLRHLEIAAAFRGRYLKLTGFVADPEP
jgi:tetratricopeptide (TPR) repeat protein